jgi:hypothetical protein
MVTVSTVAVLDRAALHRGAHTGKERVTKAT